MRRRPCGTGEECMEMANKVTGFVEDREYGGKVEHGYVQDLDNGQ